MPRWEICKIGSRRTVATQTSFLRAGNFTQVWEAWLFVPNGGLTVIAESAEYKAGGTGDVDPELYNQLHALIARLGHDGWEPMPLPSALGSGELPAWYFKRQLPDD